MVSVYCDGATWKGKPELGFWCYDKPENPGPQKQGREQEQVSKVMKALGSGFSGPVSKSLKGLNEETKNAIY